jgi:hypothetical protein
MGQELLTFVRTLTPEDDSTIDHSLMNRWRFRIVGIGIMLERLRAAASLDLNQFEPWEPIVQILVHFRPCLVYISHLIFCYFSQKELVELQWAISRFNDIDLRFPEEVQKAFEVLTGLISPDALHLQQSLRFYLRNQISEMRFGPGAIDRWVRTQYLNRTVIIKPRDKDIIHLVLQEEWDHQSSEFGLIMDTIANEDYQYGDRPISWEYMRGMLVSLMLMQTSTC